MRKLTLPKHPHTGLKIFCKTCRVDNPNCKHYSNQIYRVRIHVPGTGSGVKTKFLTATEYEDAVLETIQFQKELSSNCYTRVIEKTDIGTDYNIGGAIIKYHQYLSGKSSYAHLKKDVSKGYIDETIRYCKLFAKNLKKTRDIRTTRVTDIQKTDVANFYKWAEGLYAEKTFNKCLNSVKSFYEFLIDVEEIEMRNPFRNFVTKTLPPASIDTITQKEFKDILEAIDTADPICNLGGKYKKKNRFKPYLKDGIQLFLYTGGRREEVVNLKWSEIFTTENGIETFVVDNLKVKRIKKNKKEYKKYFPVNVDFKEYLMELGMEEKLGKDEYIFYPNRTETSASIMDNLSKGFSHYKEAAGIKKTFSLSNLRKAYISWTHQVMGNQTGLLTSHSTTQVLKDYYLDPKVLSAVERAALEVRVFGKK
jgi:integrase